MLVTLTTVLNYTLDWILLVFSTLTTNELFQVIISIPIIFYLINFVISMLKSLNR